MASEIKANKISPATGTAFTLGDSGDTFTIPSGTTLDIASGATIDATGATATGFGVSNTGTIVRRNTDQSLAKNVITKVQFDTAVLNPNSWFDVSTNHRFQPDESGNYLFIAELGHNYATSSNYVTIYFYKNGAEVYAADWMEENGYDTHITASAIIDMNGSSDYVEVYTQNGGNGTLSLQATSHSGSTATQNRLSIARLS